jgi:putative ABC transport system substrate-binding protein
MTTRTGATITREAVPGAISVVIFWHPKGIIHPQLLREAEVAAHALQLQLRPIGVSTPDDVETAFGTATQGRADALITFPSGMLWNHRARVVQLAAGHRLPALYPEREFVDAGGLMSYGPSVPGNVRRATTYVDKILKGANPADLPVEPPTTFELVINLKIAQVLGLTMPPTLLFQADEVIR